MTDPREWREDVLGPPYTSTTLALRPDAEGEVVATLVHRPSEIPSLRAVLHVHGFADYFFQTAAADFWTSRGYDFYALDLRKYGRSLLPHQTPNYVADLTTYQEELDVGYAEVAAEHETVVVSAHSTGGLVAPLWLEDRRPLVAGLFLNAPWLDMQGTALLRRVTMPLLHGVGGRQPMRRIPRTVDGIYARSLHQAHGGEWDFSWDWKPEQSWPVYAGWIRAVRTGQRRVGHGLSLDLPVLTLCSARSGHPTSDDDPDARATDIVLDVEQIRRRAPLVSQRTHLRMIQGAMHDVTLSSPPVREVVFEELARWLTTYVEGGS